MRRTEPPVEVQVLGQEGAGEQTRAVVHPALARELAHAGVDDRIAGAALLPGRERAGVVAPAHARAGRKSACDVSGRAASSCA